jgi:type VI secretion system protein ImpC
MASSVTTKDRVSIVYRTEVGGKQTSKELPMKTLVLADLTGRPDGTPLEQRRTIDISQANYDKVMESLGIRLHFDVPDLVCGSGQMGIELSLSGIDSLSPDGVTKQVPMLTHLLGLRAALLNRRCGRASAEELALYIADMSTRMPGPLQQLGNGAGGPAQLDAMVATIDRLLSAQVNAVIHHPAFQRMERSWRALKLLVDSTDSAENTIIEIINVSRDDLQIDFEDSPDITRSGLFKKVYTAEYGQFGGEPFGLIIADYVFDASPRDIALLQKIAAVASMAHAPFVAAAAPRMFGIDNHTHLAALTDLHALFEGPQYRMWQSFRDSDDSRSVVLTVPRCLLRQPFDPSTQPIKGFVFTEDASQHESHCWGSTAFALAARVHDSFARYRWGPNIIGANSGGAVSGLAQTTLESLGSLQTRMPLEVLISERREYELSEEGFVALTFHAGTEIPCFVSANSTQRGRSFANTSEGKDAEINHRLGTQLPYLLIVNRLAHYVKVLQREQIGSWKDRSVMERELNKWISAYVADVEDASPDVRGRRPLRSARISVEEVAGEAGWYRVGMQIQPHFKYMGTSFTLALTGRLDRK